MYYLRLCWKKQRFDTSSLIWIAESWLFSQCVKRLASSNPQDPCDVVLQSSSQGPFFDWSWKRCNNKQNIEYSNKCFKFHMFLKQLSLGKRNHVQPFNLCNPDSMTIICRNWDPVYRKPQVLKSVYQKEHIFGNQSFQTSPLGVSVLYFLYIWYRFKELQRYTPSISNM